MRRKLSNAYNRCVLLHGMPDDLLSDTVTPNRTSPAHTPKQAPVHNHGSLCPDIQGRLHPIGNWDGSNVPALADQIDHRPVLFALLDVSNLEFGYFSPTKTATQKYGQHACLSPSAPLPPVIIGDSGLRSASC